MPASRTAVDGLDVVEVAVGGEHPADAGGPADLEQQLVLVGGVDEHRVAVLLVADDEHVVLVRADDDLVDPDVRRLVVRGPGGRAGTGQGTGRRPAAERDGNWTGRSSTVDPGPMDFRDTPAEAAFRDEVRTWLAEHLVGEFAALGPGGGPADETGYDVRVEWERLLGRDRWVGMSWPKEYGGRDAGIVEQVIFNEEYAKAGAPARISFFGEGLFAPTLIAYGTEEQKQRFLPKIQSVEELWCQGYSEPNAGSDLSNVQTRAVLDGDEWVINGQKVWTTLAHRADWCFCVCRTDPDAPAHKGLSYLLVPMHQPGVDGARRSSR